MTIFGWDASHYDWSRGPINIGGAVASGIEFMTHKATEGTTYTDPWYATWAGRAHGVVPLAGAYHVLHSGNILAQVHHFLSVLDRQSPWWGYGPFLVQLDCEKWPTDFPGLADITAWCEAFEDLTGGWHVPVVYASRGQYGDSLRGLKWPLWNAAYPSENAGSFRGLYPGDRADGWTMYSGQTPVLWQFTSNGVIGSQAQCDVNAFRGTVEQLMDIVNGAEMTDFGPSDVNAWREAVRVEAGLVDFAETNAAGEAMGIVTAIMKIQASVDALAASIIQLRAALPKGSGTVSVSGTLSVTEQ